MGGWANEYWWIGCVGWVDEWLDGWVDGWWWMGGGRWLDEWMNRWMMMNG